MLKRTVYIYIIILCLFLSTSTLFAKVRKPRSARTTHHYFYSNITPAYSIIFDDLDNTEAKGGFGSIVGLGYSFVVPNFWFEVGAEMQMLSSYMTITDEFSDKRIKDTEGDEVTYHYNKELWYDRQDLLYVGMPVMFGYHHDNGFTIGVGFKYSLNVLGLEHNRLRYSISATYNDYIEDFEDMPNHFYGDYESYARGNITNRVNSTKAAVCLEVGYEVYDNHKNYIRSRRRHVLLRLSSYFECGVSQLMSRNYEPQGIYTLHTSNPAKLLNTPYYLSDNSCTMHTVPFMVGVRLTYTLATITCRTCKR
jgi:hypothetical protein